MGAFGRPGKALLAAFATEATDGCPVAKPTLKSNINGRKRIRIGLPHGVAKGILPPLTTPYDYW